MTIAEPVDHQHDARPIPVIFCIDVEPRLRLVDRDDPDDWGSSVEAFARGLGFPCRSMRFGDRWLSTKPLNFSEKLGVRYDLTVEPGSPRRQTPIRTEQATGYLPDYFRVPREPYTPDRQNFRRSARSGSRKLRVIPLTSSHLAGLPLRRRASRLWRNGFRYRRQGTPFLFWKRWSPPNTFTELLDRSLDAQDTPYLAFAIRSSSGARRDERTTVADNFRDLLAHPQAHRFVFCSPAEALSLWDCGRRHSLTA